MRLDDWEIYLFLKNKRFDGVVLIPLENGKPELVIHEDISDEGIDEFVNMYILSLKIMNNDDLRRELTCLIKHYLKEFIKKLLVR